MVQMVPQAPTVQKLLLDQMVPIRLKQNQWVRKDQMDPRLSRHLLPYLAIPIIPVDLLAPKAQKARLDH